MLWRVNCLKTRYLVMYNFHFITIRTLHRLERLKRMNPNVTFVPCFGIKQRIYLPAFLGMQFIPIKFLNWSFLRWTPTFELSKTLNIKVESARRKTEIDALRDYLKRRGMNLHCDFTPMGYYNLDIVILNWFLSEGKNFDFDFLIFFEHDMFATKSIKNLYSKYERYDACFVNYWEAHPSWYWYRYPPGGRQSVRLWLNNRKLNGPLYSCMFCGNMISREVLTKIDKTQLPYGHCEMRWPSIIKNLGFSCARLDFPMVRYRPPLSKSYIKANWKYGLFHPVYDDINE
jgi:hypothetical protein